MFLTDISLKRPVLATVSILALVALGLISYFSLGINEWPEVEFPYVAVTVVEPGASPQQVEDKIVRKVEDAISQVSGVKHIYANVQEGVALVYAEFTLDTVPSVAAQDVRDKLGTIRGELPDDAKEPVITRIDPAASPIVSLAVSGDRSLEEITALVDDTIQKKLETVDGVGAVNVLGEQHREIQIQLDKDKLAAYGLTIPEVINGLHNENLEVPAGKISAKDKEMTLRTIGKIQRIQDFGNVPVAQRGGVQIYVRDIAKVVDGVKDPDSISFYQGKPSVGIDIIKQSGSNTVKVADSIRQAVKEMQPQLPSGVRLDVVRDNSVNIRNSVSDVFNNILEGGILAILTVLLFLGNWRTTMISAIAIPTSIITTFFAMKLLDYTLNVMSLMALSLCVGLLIDDAIVVIENIERHLRMGKNPLQAAKEATSEIGLAVLATTFTLVAVFFPVGMMSGITGKFFKQFGITVVVAVLVSLFVSFTLVPLLSSRYLKTEERRGTGPLGRFLSWFQVKFDRVAEVYAAFLRLALRHRIKALAIVTVLFLSSLILVPFLGVTFMPVADSGEITVAGVLDAGLTQTAAAALTHKVEDIIRTYPEVTATYSTVKQDTLSVYVKLKDKQERQRSVWQLMADMRPKLAVLPGIQVSLNAVASMQSGKDIQYSLVGDNLDEMEKYSEKTVKILEQMPGILDVSSSYKPGKPEENLQVKPDTAADLGVSTALVANTLYTLYNGTVVSQYRENDKNYDVRVVLDPAQRTHLQGLDDIYLPGGNTGQGGPPMISLAQVTNKVFAPAPSEINRFDRNKEIQISANLTGMSLGEFETKFNQAIKTLNLPPGYHLIARGQSEFMGESNAAMGTALIIGVLFIFFILAAQFESYIDPFSIMFSLPMAIIGAILGLLVTGSVLGMMSNIGIIMLMGLVTKNAILLIDFAKQARAQGVERNEALIRAGRIRLRPIIMTSVAMILGMLPLALGLGHGGEARAPMAHAIIGGLITSTLLTLVVVPLMYTVFDDIRNKFRPGSAYAGRAEKITM